MGVFRVFGLFVVLFSFFIGLYLGMGGSVFKVRFFGFTVLVSVGVVYEFLCLCVFCAGVVSAGYLRVEVYFLDRFSMFV